MTSYYDVSTINLAQVQRTKGEYIEPNKGVNNGDPFYLIPTRTDLINITAAFEEQLRSARYRQGVFLYKSPGCLDYLAMLTAFVVIPCLMAYFTASDALFTSTTIAETATLCALLTIALAKLAHLCNYNRKMKETIQNIYIAFVLKACQPYLQNEGLEGRMTQYMFEARWVNDNNLELVRLIWGDNTLQERASGHFHPELLWDKITLNAPHMGKGHYRERLAELRQGLGLDTPTDELIKAGRRAIEQSQQAIEQSQQLIAQTQHLLNTSLNTAVS